jgi:ribonuclease D
LLADPSILKVLHGGANDVLWLQRDAHLYLVNVFDTEKAALVRLYDVVVQSSSG